ncbi:hypothetical protein [Neorhizobium tomejilense]|uniref:hypothetical protein n=1 Tax=Neorhizobium tomejilense TaxID=2093828 RepID=UPI003F4FEAC8
MLRHSFGAGANNFRGCCDIFSFNANQEPFNEYTASGFQRSFHWIASRPVLMQRQDCIVGVAPTNLRAHCGSGTCGEAKAN